MKAELLAERDRVVASAVALQSLERGRVARRRATALSERKKLEAAESALIMSVRRRRARQAAGRKRQERRALRDRLRKLLRGEKAEELGFTQAQLNAYFNPVARQLEPPLQPMRPAQANNHGPNYGAPAAAPKAKADTSNDEALARRL